MRWAQAAAAVCYCALTLCCCSLRGRTLISNAEDPFPFVATELLEGARTFRELQCDDDDDGDDGDDDNDDDAQPLDPERCRALAAGATAALHAIHRLGVVHGDVREDNLVMMPDGSVRVLDFGRAWLEAGPEDQEKDLRNLAGFVWGLHPAEIL